MVSDPRRVLCECFNSGFDVCLFTVLVGQVGGLRAGKTFFGLSAGGDFAANFD
jgi:hypothetical protein